MPTLSVSDLEADGFIASVVWMKRYLGIEAPDDTANPWAATSGKWVHRWLASIGEQRKERFSCRFLRRQRSTNASGFRPMNDATLQKLCDLLGKIVPDWWISGWLNARYLARHLGAKIASAEGWSWMAAELPIGRESAVKIADNVELQLRGQNRFGACPKRRCRFRRPKPLDRRLQNRFDQGTEEFRSPRQAGKRHRFAAWSLFIGHARARRHGSECEHSLARGQKRRVRS